ncbi:hypothetical protein AOLI_G00310520 [Acnodon oligacanthus]
MWRFPYLCYKNGGGAFLIPYFIFLFTCGIPTFFLETALGQYTSEGGITCWRKISPLFEGLGYGTQVIVSLMNCYYIVVLGWAIFYLYFSFSWDLPWSSCHNSWNLDTCVEFQRKNDSAYFTLTANATSPVIEFWERRVLRVSPGIDQMGSLNWDLALCLLIAWVMCYFCIWKGVKSAGKVVYFTATFPYLMLLVFLIRGLTLPGAVRGIQFYLYPDMGRLADPQVWMDAGTQIFFSYALCIGSLMALGSYNKYNNNCYRDCLALCFLNGGTSFVSGFAIFSILGFMSYEQNVPISEVAESGPGLAFIAYPRAVSMMPFSPLWACFFFIMIIFLGLDSQFVSVESLVTAIVDMYPAVFRCKNRRELLLLVVSVLSFLVGLIMLMEVRTYGPGLAFIAYPRAVSMMPFSPLWACFFFIMIIFLGLDSQFVSVESLVTAIVDMYPAVFRCKNRRELLLLVVSVLSFLVGLIMLMEGGMYVFQLFDYYAASGMCLLFMAIFETVCISWVYGADRFYDNIEDMIGYRPGPLIKYCWKFFTPFTCIVSITGLH